jgi:hypothetical protein
MKSYKDEILCGSDFRGADIRGADFSGANLSDSDFSGCRSGLTIFSAVILLTLSLIISILSGYIAVLTGESLRFMMYSADYKLVVTGYFTLALFFAFLLLSMWRGERVMFFLLPFTISFIHIIGLIARFTGIGTGEGALQSSLSLIFLLMMVLVGTISRAVAGTTSSIVLFIIVAVSGPMFGQFVAGGGFESIVLAIACAIMSKQVLSEKSKFPVLKKISLIAGTHFGTSFANADLSGANFSGSDIKNTNFKGANLDRVNWENSKKEFVLEDFHK